MANNSTSICKFYIDNITWLKSLGIGYTNDHDKFGFNIPSATITNSSTATIYINYYYHDLHPEEYKDENGNPVDPQAYLPITYNFCASLGHKFGTDGQNFNELLFNTKNGQGTYWGTGDHVNVIPLNTTPEIANSLINGDLSDDGYSIWTFDDLSSFVNGSYHDSIFFTLTSTSADNHPIRTGKFIAGQTYTMSHAPDLTIQLSYETGTKTIETLGGSSLSNTIWRPPMWGNLAPWELHNPIPGDDPSTQVTEYEYVVPLASQKLARSSRKIYDLSFSFLSNENTFPKYDSLNTLAEEPNVSDPDQYTLTDSNDFFSRVWNKVGNHSPFIFQADESVPEFIIAKFDQKNISFRQTAPNLYSVKCRIREVW